MIFVMSYFTFTINCHLEKLRSLRLILYTLTKFRYCGQLKCEVNHLQDLIPSQLKLFDFVCSNTNGFIFAGDTAQTIARGVGFRFDDIRSFFFSEILKHHDGTVLIAPLVVTYTEQGNLELMSLTSTILLKTSVPTPVFATLPVALSTFASISFLTALIN